MKSRCCFMLLLVILWLSAALGRAQGNLIINGSFENSFTGWNLDMSLPYFYQIGSATNCPQGNCYAYFANNGGVISQTISTVAGDYYCVSLSAIEFAGTNTVSISANGSLLATLNFTTAAQSPLYDSLGGYVFNTVWDSFSYTFEAASASTTLAFSYIPQAAEAPNTTDVYYGTGGLDAISVMTVPEPSSATLLGAGLIGVLAYLRRNRLKAKPDSGCSALDEIA